MIDIGQIGLFVFDFDGVLTDNRVYLSQNGEESVACFRGDGMAFDLLRKLEKPVYILSTEGNPVVTARANKLRTPVMQGVENKVNGLIEIADKESVDLSNVLYVGNDLNDYRAMQRCGYSACPSDSHPMIREIATIQLESRGGDGVARELLEYVLRGDFLEILYPE